MTFITENSKIKNNKYALRAELEKTIAEMFRKDQRQTSVSSGGIAINASGDASVSITSRGDNSPVIIGSVLKGGLTVGGRGNSNAVIINSAVEGPIPKGSIVIKDGKIFKDNKDITPDVVTGKLSFEERGGETFVNGKPLKR